MMNRVGMLLLFAMLAFPTFPSEVLNKEQWKQYRESPSGTFIVNGCEWNFYTNVNYAYSSVWPVGDITGDAYIPDTVGGLPVGECFGLKGCDAGWTLNVPGTVREIGSDHFGNYTLTNLVVRDESSVPTVIQYGALMRMERLVSVSLGEGVVRIEADAFRGCTNLVSVKLPTTLRAIENGVFTTMDAGFYDAPETIKVLEGDEYGNYYVGKWVIVGADPKHIRADTRGLADEAFANSGMSAVLPEGIEYIGARSCMSGLPSKIPDSVKSIGCNAFGQVLAGSPLEVDERGVCYMDGWCFGPADITDWCTDETEFLDVDEPLDDEMWKEFYEMVKANVERRANAIIRPGTKGIASGAFNTTGIVDNNTLTNIVFPASLRYIGDNAFERCFALKSFNTPTNVETIGRFAFSQCAVLEEVRLGPKQKVLEYGTFYEIPNLTNIYCYAEYFEPLSLYDYVKISHYVDDKGASWAIRKNPEWEEVIDYERDIPKNLHLHSGIRHVGQMAWKRINLHFEEGVTDIGGIVGGEDVGEIVIPGSVTNIAENAFDACPGLSRVVINIVNSESVKFAGKVFTKNYQIKVIALPYNAKGYEDLIAELGEEKVKFVVGTESGYGQWVLVNGLAGKGSEADFGGKSGGNKYENGFLYVFGNDIENESEAIIQLEKTKEGRIAFRLPQAEHEDKVKVIGTSNLNDWSNAVELRKEGDVWVLPDGTEPPSSFFCRVVVEE